MFFSLEDSTPLGFDFLVATDSTEKSCDTWLCSDLSLSKACHAERFCLRCDFLELCGVIPSLNFCGVFFFAIFEGVPSRTWAACVPIFLVNLHVENRKLLLSKFCVNFPASCVLCVLCAFYVCFISIFL